MSPGGSVHLCKHSHHEARGRITSLHCLDGCICTDYQSQCRDSESDHMDLQNLTVKKFVGTDLYIKPPHVEGLGEIMKGWQNVNISLV